MSFLVEMERTSGRRPESAGEARLEVAVACRMIARYGHEDLTLGHVSVRGLEQGEVYIKAKGKALGEVTPDDVMLIRLDHVDCHLAPGAHLETVMHTEAYRARPTVGAAIHTHPLYATALGATSSTLADLTDDAVLFRDGVGVFDASVGMVTSQEDGRRVVQALGDRRAVLLKNHGIFVVGEDIRWAVLAAITLERAARVQTIASALGPFTPIPEGDIHEIYPMKYQEAFLDEYWAAWNRMLAEPMTGHLA